jgi:CDP-paratose 2-epimerase
MSPNKILVTGGCGFLGSHVCELFHHQGWEVVAYDNLTKFEYSRAFKNVTEVRDYNLRYLENLGIPVIIEDILNYKMLSKVAQDCDMIAHCAAQPAMTIALEDPMLDFENNVRGTINVLQAAREARAAVVNCSSIHVYGNEHINRHLTFDQESCKHINCPTGYTEEHPLLKGIVTPLHASKLAAEHYVRAYADSYYIPTATFRLTGIYGPRQFGGEDHGWVANFAIRALLGQPLTIFGNDQQVRDILYVRNAAEAFYNWYTSNCPIGTYNLGGGPYCARSIKQVIHEIENLSGCRTSRQMADARKGDLWWFICDSALATKTFHWIPDVFPTEGLFSLISWIQQERHLFELAEEN